MKRAAFSSSYFPSADRRVFNRSATEFGRIPVQKNCSSQHRSSQRSNKISATLLRVFSQWPTIPQLYVKGEFIDRADIVREMYQSGELTALLKEKGVAMAGA
jgi:hypothetical protein